MDPRVPDVVVQRTDRGTPKAASDHPLIPAAATSIETIAQVLSAVEDRRDDAGHQVQQTGKRTTPGCISMRTSSADPAQPGTTTAPLPSLAPAGSAAGGLPRGARQEYGRAAALLATVMARAFSSTPGGRRASRHLDRERLLIQDHLAELRRGFRQVVEASADSNADDEHDPEGATIAFERSQLESLIHQAERHLADIEDARARVSGGRYGRCERCGEPISPARLGARPAARTCIGCASLAS
jgi:RNA polymerase-binding transcription factor DksA